MSTDIPASLAGEVETEQHIQFRPAVPLPDDLLESLPEVTNVIYRGDVVVVTGNGNAFNAVISALARHQIVARHLRVDGSPRGWPRATPSGVDSSRGGRR